MASARGGGAVLGAFGGAYPISPGIRDELDLLINELLADLSVSNDGRGI